MGASRSIASARELANNATAAVWIMGVAGAIDQSLRPGDVVVADSVRDQRSGAELHLEGTSAVASALSELGLRVRTGPLLTAPKLVRGSEERAALARTGALAVDMETYPLATAGWGGPVIAIRTISDTAEHGLISPRVLTGGVAALRSLQRCAEVLPSWSAHREP